MIYLPNWSIAETDLTGEDGRVFDGDCFSPRGIGGCREGPVTQGADGDISDLCSQGFDLDQDWVLL